MALIAGGTLLLAGSHPLAWYLGSEGGHRTSRAGQRISPEEEEASQASLLKLLQQRRAERAAELQRQREEQQRAEAAADEPGANDARDQWEKTLDAGRAKMAAYTNAELEAALDALADAEENEGNLILENMAALDLWLERDADAALAWLAQRSAYGDYSIFIKGMGRWMESRGCKDLATLLERFPGAAAHLMTAASLVAEERGSGFALELAATLRDPVDRWAILQGAVFGSGQAAEVARALPLIDQRWRTEVLSLASHRPFAAGFAEEMRKAGLPEDMIAQYEQLRTEFKAPDQSEQNPRPAEMDPVAAVLERLADATVADSSWHTYVNLKAVLPDFVTWCDEIRDGRMTPQQLMAKAKEAWPQAAAQEAALRTQVFRKIFTQDPAATMQWWQTSGGGDWPGGISDAVGDLSAEQMVEVLDRFPDFENGAMVEDAVLRKFAKWEKDDPEPYQKAMARLQARGVRVAGTPDEGEEAGQ